MNIERCELPGLDPKRRGPEMFVRRLILAILLLGFATQAIPISVANAAEVPENAEQVWRPVGGPVHDWDGDDGPGNYQNEELWWKWEAGGFTNMQRSDPVQRRAVLIDPYCQARLAILDASSP